MTRSGHSIRGSAGRFTRHSGIRAQFTTEGRPPVADVIAAKTLVVHDEAIGIDRQLIAGQPVPPDLVDAYHAEIGEAAEDSAQGPGYDAESVEDLQAEADRRELSVEGTGSNGNVLKKDLVAALQADDAK